MTNTNNIQSKLDELASIMLPDTDMTHIFTRATESAERFGKSISYVLDSYIEFARKENKG